MGEFASKGMAGTALGFGIGGTALGLLNNSGGCGNGGLLGNLLGGGNRNECYETKEAAILREQLSTCRSERFAEGIGISAYKDSVALSNKNDEKLQSNMKDVFVAIADLDKREAVNQANINCLYKTLDTKIDAVHSELLSDIKCLGLNTNSRFDALRSETASAIALEGERRINGDTALSSSVSLEAERRSCGDNSIMSYVQGTYVPGKLIMPLSAICPPAMPLCSETHAGDTPSVTAKKAA